ncbi:dicer-like protein 2 [Podospora fimiseda]|uniref:Dicer-like protein 2 n=1 Tax=Podospora fimiseda TaxID=252190 RepID=A0AAN7GZY2_9PEZI|nr:dicer-like protein 2 [Podospora fimiseda]
MAARAYQLEMLEESLKRNIIVAMDTGSGKTQVAVMRIRKEIERSDKLVWFLAPMVELAHQQFEVIASQIPEVQAKLIAGASNIDSWKMKADVWDAVLTNVRIVVSTYQILFDAVVSHGFVKMERLGLVVIDEAHYCAGNNSVARFMREGYARAKAEGRPVPHILGLTASPVVGSDISSLDVLERTLDAVCKTPTRNRSELMSRVNRPDMIAYSYSHFPPPEYDELDTPILSSLSCAFKQLDISKDPKILRMRQAVAKSGSGLEDLKDAIMKHDTPCQNQMKSFYNRARETFACLGPWAAEYYSHKAIDLLSRQCEDTALQTEDKTYLSNALAEVQSIPLSLTPTCLSQKTQALVEILESYEGNPIGIVFVRERSTAVVLAHTLSNLPCLASRYRVGSMVGTSGQRSFLDLNHKKADAESLKHFRTGKINLLIATNVLEEGIDVPMCNLVICFEKPMNLKSFIQRRGRARMSDSKLYLLVESESDTTLEEWQNLEREMKQKYEDEMREIAEFEKYEDTETDDYPVLRNPDTGAQLTIQDAKIHLDHFCNTMSTRKYVNWLALYTLHDLDGNLIESHQPGLRKAVIHLPIVLAPELRRAESLRAWTSESIACKDAAFQAYKQLYDAGLINSNLLPKRETDLLPDVPQRDGIVFLREQFNPWPLIAQAWRNGAKLSRRKLTISHQDKQAQFELVLPVPIPYMKKFVVHWDSQSYFEVEMSPDVIDAEAADTSRESQKDHSLTLLAMAYGHRFPIHYDKQYPIRLVSLDQDISPDDIGALEISLETARDPNSNIDLVRHMVESKQPYWFQSQCLSKKPKASTVKRVFWGFDTAPEDGPYLVVTPLPKKAGYFQQQEHYPESCPHTCPAVLPLERVRADRIPSVFTKIGMLIPAIMQALENHLIATDLLESSQLQTLGITDLSLVVMALLCPGAKSWTDYERIEFLGDSILKFCTSIYLCAEHTYYTEGYLSASREKILSNSRLYRATLALGLDKYIISKAFTRHKWRPTYVEDLIEEPPSDSETRSMSTKTLADVVEALIGACYIEGGIPKALKCLSLFIPEAKWTSIPAYQQTLYEAAPSDETLPLTLQGLEELIGYTFTKKSLVIEAMTHPSYSAPGTRASYDRLEFLGDSILDYLVVRKIFSVKKPKELENFELHLVRTALVNADILGFLIMEWCKEEVSVDVEVTQRYKKQNIVKLVESKARIPLSSFMRHSSPDLGAALKNTWQRHEEMREQLLDELLVSAQKVQSDLFEALLGAVWIDSGGSIPACEAFIERSGLFGLMRRLLEDEVHIMHPKEELNHYVFSKCEYNVFEVVKEGEGDEEGTTDITWGCEITSGGEVVARFPGGGFSKEDARVKAAQIGGNGRRIWDALGSRNGSL